MRLVVRFSSIRLMLAIVAISKRMKDNILNGEPDEEIDMEKPTEFWVKGNEFWDKYVPFMFLNNC